MLREISETEREILYNLTYIYGIYKHGNSVEWKLSGVEGQKKLRDVGQSIQTSIYKINQLWGSNILHCNYS